MFQGFEVENDDDLARLRGLCKTVYVEVSAVEAEELKRKQLYETKPATPGPEAVPGTLSELSPDLTARMGLVPPKDPTPLKDELSAAKGIYGDARRTMTKMFDRLRRGGGLDLQLMEGVVDTMVDSIFRNREAMCWLARMKSKDDYLYSHSLAVSVWALAFGRHLGLDKPTLRSLGMGAMVLDIGKMQLPTALLQKAEQPDAKEWLSLKAHVLAGLAVLEADPRADALMKSMLLTHHERLDGSGYPNQLLGDAIQAASASLAVVLINLADMSRFQARLGYAATENVLQRLCGGFVEALSARGQIIRLGDGCFCAIVRSVRNPGHAVLAGEKFARTAEELLNDAGVAIKPRVSIGVALFPSHATEAEPLLRQSQLAAEASRTRAERVVVFDQACDTEVLAPWALGNDFTHALETGELSVYYQPKISMSTGMPVGVESLMRWLRDGKPVATPDVFIPLAEEAGLIHSATWYSLSNSLRMSADSSGLSVAVNITPGMLHHREFIDMVRTALSTWGIKDRRLTVEVTEGALIADFAEATARLKRLRDLGVRVSIDDFGTGYSSLSYFKKIPADELKIDKSFVMGMTQDPADHRLVCTIVGLAQHFNLDIVAEGVEDRQTFDALAELGCHQAQGYLFSPALSRDRLNAWMAANTRDLRVRLPE